jgi:hypothetical protein
MSSEAAGSELAEVERELRRAGVLLCDPRLLRRVIKLHRNAGGVAPHGRCYALPKADLLKIVQPPDLGVLPNEIAEHAILLSRPLPRDVQGRSKRELLSRMWRAVFHARVHMALDRRVAEGKLDEAEVRRRIDTVGQTEFDEVRSILRQDDLVLPPGDDRQVYIEFAALYLELRHFAPGLLVSTFPGLEDHARIAAALALDIDIKALLEQDRPVDVEAPAATRELEATSMPSFSAPAAFPFAERMEVRPVTQRVHQRLLYKAAAARAKGNDVKALLLCARAVSVQVDSLRSQATAAARAAVERLEERLGAALQGAQGEAVKNADWTSLLLLLADRAAADRAGRYAVEARLLYQLQRACVAYERPQKCVDVAGWLLSRFKRNVVRQLPATRELAVARTLVGAARRVRNTRLSPADRKLLMRLLDWACERAERNVRVALRPGIEKVFDDVGLVATTVPERMAREKIVDELVDRVLESGFLSLDALRDALSRNQLKLEDLRGPGELFQGDALLRADAGLDVELDGVYRRGDGYLRFLQKLSSLPFGTRIGRAITLFAALPLGGAYVVLLGLELMAHPIFALFGHHAPKILSWPSFAAAACVIFALIHSGPFRTFALQVVEVVAWLLATLLWRLPRGLLTQAAVQRFLSRPLMRAIVRHAVRPVLPAVLVYFLAPWKEPAWLRVAIAGVSFVLVSVLMGTRAGVWLEDFALDQVAPTWQVVSRQWLPGLLRSIMKLFEAMVDLMLRAMYRVDELLLFREGESRFMLVVKGGAGVVWGIFAWFVRLYVVLMVEPFINPLKHFPTVVVADKLMLSVTVPWSATIPPLILHYLPSILGIVGAAFAAVSIFLLPSFFGFLAWELKENYRLYRETRPDRLTAAPVGPHGETMRGLLVVGFHSGTLPKLYQRLRRAAQREDEHFGARWRRARHEPLGSGGLGRFREGIRRIEQSVRRFVARELCALLERCPRWPFGPITIVRLGLSSNRIRCGLRCTALGNAVCELSFEEQSGYVVASVVEPGFVTELLKRSALGLRLFENALAGLYQRSEVDLVREQVEGELGERATYDIADDGLLVWPGTDYRTELVYKLKGRRKNLSARVLGAPPTEPPAILDRHRIFFHEQVIAWDAWVTAWSAASLEGAEVPPLLRGITLLPVVAAAAPAAPVTPTPTPAASPLLGANAPVMAPTVAAPPVIVTQEMPAGSVPTPTVAKPPAPAATVPMPAPAVTVPMPDRGHDGGGG